MLPLASFGHKKRASPKAGPEVFGGCLSLAILALVPAVVQGVHEARRRATTFGRAGNVGFADRLALAGRGNGEQDTDEHDGETEHAHEGLVRDLIRLVQQTRKELDLQITARIGVTIAGPAEVLEAVRTHQQALETAVLATSVSLVPELPAALGDDDPAVRRATLDGNDVAVHITS